MYIGSRLIVGAAHAAGLSARAAETGLQNLPKRCFLLSVLDGKHYLPIGPPLRKHRNTSFLLSVLAGKHSFKIVFFTPLQGTIKKSDYLQNRNERKSSASYSIFERPGSPEAAPETPFLTPKKHNSRRRLTTKYLKYLRFL